MIYFSQENIITASLSCRLSYIFIFLILSLFYSLSLKCHTTLNLNDFKAPIIKLLFHDNGKSIMIIIRVFLLYSKIHINICFELKRCALVITCHVSACF